MPRFIVAGAAGHNLLFGPPGTPAPGWSGRGSVGSRATTLSALSLSALAEMKFEGNTDLSIRTDEIRGTAVAVVNTLGGMVLEGEQFSYHSAGSIQYNNISQNWIGVTVSIPTYYGFELWYRDSLTERDSDSYIISRGDNTNVILGGDKTILASPLRFPSMINMFNNVIEFNSEVEFGGRLKSAIGDGEVHQLFQFTDTGAGLNFVVCIDGMPVAVGTTGGLTTILQPTFNGQDVATAASLRFGGEISSFIAHDNGSNLTLKDVRNIYETTALNKWADMLPMPRWFVLDGVNVVVGTYDDTFAQLGDVTDATGIRSGAIQRIVRKTPVIESGAVGDRRNTYFELEIIDQGDDATATLIGLRKLAEGGSVGNLADAAGDAVYLKAGKLYDGANVILPTGSGDDEQDASTLGNPITGRIYRFAIPWDEFQPTMFFIGDEASWKGRVGSPDPETFTDGLGFLNTAFNWAAWIRTNGASGNGKVRIRSKFYEMRLPIPAGYVPWVPQDYVVEDTVYGVNQIRSIFDFNGWSDHSPHREWKFEGPSLGFVDDDTGLGNHGSTLSSFGTHVYQQPQICIPSIDSLNLVRGGVNLLKQGPDQTAYGNPDMHCWELWYQQTTDFAATYASIVASSNNRYKSMGKYPGRNFPSYVNHFNNSTKWESAFETNGYTDGKPHQFMEFHEQLVPDNSSTFTIMFDGIPIDKRSTGGWFESSLGDKFEFNGDLTSVGVNGRAGGDWGYFQTIRGGDLFNIFKARQLYEAGVWGTSTLGSVGGEFGGSLTDQQFTVKSFTAPNNLARDGRLNNSPGWIQAVPYDVDDWIQIDFLNTRRITEIKTQGGDSGTEYVTGYELEYSMDGVVFTSYNNNEVLVGNTTGNDDAIVTNVLIPFICRYVRLIPKTWNVAPEIRINYTEDTLLSFDMGTFPRWIALDGINVTLAGAADKDAVMGAVDNNTGIRSGAIPRRDQKVYFELEVIAQGDGTGTTHFGIRKMAEESPIGDFAAVATDEYYTDAQGSLFDGSGTQVTVTGTLGNGTTGQIYQVAINWKTGDWWIGTNNVYLGVGGVGSPTNDNFPLPKLDITHNWAAAMHIFGAFGNNTVRLITANADLNFGKPALYVAWEDATA